MGLGKENSEKSKREKLEEDTKEATRLGVNIDHVATLRQTRGGPYPSVVHAAHICLSHGADQITIHLREDRRHIQDTDVEAVRLVTQKFGKPLNLEMSVASEMIDIAMVTRPDWICLVPENREERTTEGGLDLRDEGIFEKVKKACEKLKESDPHVRISLFVEADKEILQRCRLITCDAVEIHTGAYARAHLNGEDISSSIENFKKSLEFCREFNLGHHAGHGLTGESLGPLVEENLFVEYNIGHWIICQSVFEGLPKIIKDLRKIIG